MSRDTLGRVSGVTNALGAFQYAWDGPTSRILSITGPNSFKRTYSYFDVAGDRYLKEIKNESGANPLSRFAYTYDGQGNIASWTQQAGTAAPRQYEFTYDRADQLGLAVLKTTDATPAVLKRYAYGYDQAGNRGTEQVDNLVTAASHNSVNELTSRQPGGALRFAGTTSEPATVTIQGATATAPAGNRFAGSALVTSRSS